jgi:hypothetical protein
MDFRILPQAAQQQINIPTQGEQTTSSKEKTSPRYKLKYKLALLTRLQR